MTKNKPVGRFAKILFRTDIRIFLFFSYIFALAFLLLKGYAWWSVIIVHLFFVIIYGLFYFGYEFVQIFFYPIIAIVYPIDNYLSRKYLKNFKQNIHASAVIVLGQSDWFKLEGWIKPNFSKSDIKVMVDYLKERKQDFSFYTKASFSDIEKIMSDRNIEEVYFLGHGDFYTFLLNTDEILYYCDFNDYEKYGKQFVHQVHCGTPDGKSLIDYVVPMENRGKCFFFRKPINSFDIEREFKSRITNIRKHNGCTN